MTITTPMLSPEDLGTAGEDLFRALCSQAGITCNKSERDRTGWDFRVELPFDDTDSATLDQRAPRVCQVQVKATIGETGTRVRAKLSAVERLAKDAAPAAVFILRLRGDGSPLAGYVIHLIDRDLARVLRRLRGATAEGRRDLNRMFLTFDYAKARRFELTPAGLRDVLVSLCGDDVSTYTERKQNQLANLGYEDGGLEADALVWIEGEDHLVRILSGLAPLKPLRLTAYDTRFGIRLPYEGALLDGIEEITVQPPHIGSCQITIRKGPRDPAAVFAGEAFRPPPLPGAPLMVIRHPVLTATFTEDGLNIETVNFIAGRHSLADCRLLLRALTYVDSGTGSVAIEFGGARLSPLPIPAGNLDGPNTEDLPLLLDIVDRWQEALDLAGVAATQPITLDDIWSARSVHIAVDILFNPEPRGRLEFDVISGAEDAQSLEALYFNSETFAGATIAYAVKVALARTPDRDRGFASTSFELFDIRAGVTDLKSYGAEQAAEAGVSILIDPDNLELTEPA